MFFPFFRTVLLFLFITSIVVSCKEKKDLINLEDLVVEIESFVSSSEDFPDVEAFAENLKQTSFSGKERAKRLGDFRKSRNQFEKSFKSLESTFLEAKNFIAESCPFCEARNKIISQLETNITILVERISVKTKEIKHLTELLEEKEEKFKNLKDQKVKHGEMQIEKIIKNMNSKDYDEDFELRGQRVQEDIERVDKKILEKKTLKKDLEDLLEGLENNVKNMRDFEVRVRELRELKDKLIQRISIHIRNQVYVDVYGTLDDPPEEMRIKLENLREIRNEWEKRENDFGCTVEGVVLAEDIFNKANEKRPQNFRLMTSNLITTKKEYDMVKEKLEYYEKKKKFLEEERKAYDLDLIIFTKRQERLSKNLEKSLQNSIEFYVLEFDLSFANSELESKELICEIDKKLLKELRKELDSCVSGREENLKRRQLKLDNLYQLLESGYRSSKALSQTLVILLKDLLNFFKS